MLKDLHPCRLFKDHSRHLTYYRKDVSWEGRTELASAPVSGQAPTCPRSTRPPRLAEGCLCFSAEVWVPGPKEVCLPEPEEGALTDWCWPPRACAKSWAKEQAGAWQLRGSWEPCAHHAAGYCGIASRWPAARDAALGPGNLGKENRNRQHAEAKAWGCRSGVQAYLGLPLGAGMVSSN